ncbi:MAG: multidrug efflux MATE transporter BexA [Ginsengibacter sp.]
MELNDDLKVKVTNKQILHIALPISMALIIPNINFITNNIFLGGLGERELGNAGTTGVFYLIMMVTGNGLNNALQSLISRKAGEGKENEINKLFSQGIRIALMFAFVWMMITWFIAPICLKHFIKPENYEQEMTFLRIRIIGLPFLYLFQCGNAFLIGTLNSRYMMIGTIGEALVNIFFDYVLIYGVFLFPALGFNGAAVASIIAEFTGMTIVYIVIFKQGLKHKFQLFKNFKYDKENSNEILKRSGPLVIQFTISLATWFVFFILLEDYGETAKAISSIMRNVFGIVGVFIWAFASTANTMVSNLIGQKKENQVIPVINKIALLSFGITIIAIIFLNVFPYSFFNLFKQSSAFATQGIPVLHIISIGMIGMSVATIWLNAVTGTGFTKVNLLIELISVFVYLLYVYLVMIKCKLSLSAAWANELVYWAAIFLFAFLFIKSNRWKQKLSD